MDYLGFVDNHSRFIQIFKSIFVTLWRVTRQNMPLLTFDYIPANIEMRNFHVTVLAQNLSKFSSILKASFTQNNRKFEAKKKDMINFKC